MAIAEPTSAASQLSPISGEFPDAAVERTYLDEQACEKRKTSQALFGVAAIVCLLFAVGAAYLSPTTSTGIVPVRLAAAGVSIAAYVLVRRLEDRWIEPLLVLWEIAIVISSAIVVSQAQDTALVSIFLLPAIFYLAVPTRFRTTVAVGLATSVLLFVAYAGVHAPSLEEAKLGFGLAVLNMLLAFLKSRAGQIMRVQWLSRRTAQRAAVDLAMSENLLQRTFDAVPIPIVVTTCDNGTIVMANNSAETFLEVTDGSLLGRAAIEFYALAEDRAAFAELLDASGHVQNFKANIRTKGGELRSVLLAASSLDPFGDQTRQAMVASVLDITDQEARETQLKNAEAEYRQLFENSVVGIYRSSPAGRMLRANPALVRFNGYQTEGELLSAVNDIASEWYVNPNRRAEWLRIMRDNGHVTDFVSEVYRHRTQEKVWISENSWTIFDRNGEPLCFEGSLIEATERKQSEERIERQARYDPLTNIPNRRKLLEEMDAALKCYRADGTPFAVFCLDLDRLKQVNDAFGHEAGDMLLKEAARRLEAECRNEDTVARIGGDEFTLIVSGIRDPLELAVIADRVVGAFSTPFDIGGPSALVGTSIGIAIAPIDGTDARSLLKTADLALYRAKKEGRATYRFANQSIDAMFGRRRQSVAKTAGEEISA